MIKKNYTLYLLWFLAIIVSFFSIVSGNFFTKKVSLQIGEIAKETVLAPFQVENEFATNRKRDLAETSVEERYKIDAKVQENAIGDIENLFKYVIQIQTENLAEKLSKTPLATLVDLSPIALYNDQYDVLLGMNEETILTMKAACIQIASELFEAGIDSDDTNKTLQIREALEETSLSTSQKKIATDIINYVLIPNVVVDQLATQEAKKLEREKIDPLYVLPGEKIIEQGTKVTEETYALLEKVGYLDTDKGSRYGQYLGVLLLILLISFIVFKYGVEKNLKKKMECKQISFLFIVYIIAILMMRTLIGVSYIYLPLSIFSLLIAFTIGTEIAILMHVIFVIITATIFKGDIIFIIYLLLTGLASILIVRSMLERAKTTANGLAIGLVQVISYVVLKLFTGGAFNITLFKEMIGCFVIGFIVVIAVMGTLPFIESFFGFITPMQLLDLTNPGQPMLKRLLLEATGTYYHSLLVANLAETAANSVGANPLLVRVGGYYHDIGKLSCSVYFKENQGRENPHDYLDPYESYEAILKHVTEGVKLAEAYKLPTYVQDMIRQHHGTSTMQFFYMKAKERYGDEVKESQFQYPGPKPQTKEAALIMLADVVEATVRSMQDQIKNNEQSIDDIVAKMVRQKLKEGQLDECELYLSDLDKIIEAFSKMLKGMYHERIKYPERNEK